MREPGFYLLLLPALILGALAPRAATGLTPIESADLSPDVTVVLDGQTISDEDVASDDVVTNVVTQIALGSLPGASDVVAYHGLANGDRLLSFDVTVSLPGAVTARPGDVVRYDGASYTIEFDALAESVPAGAHTDAVSVNTAGNLVLSFDITVSLSGGTFDDEDLVEFDGVGFSSFFDGSAAGLDSALDVDGAHVFPGTDHLGLSFDTSGSIGGVSFDDEDVLEYDPGGSTWEMAWDTSAERAGWATNADINAVRLVPEPGQLLMLTAGAGLLAWLRRRRVVQAAPASGRGQTHGIHASVDGSRWPEG